MSIDKSPISILQERAMGFGTPLPTYNIVQEGANFKCVVNLGQEIMFTAVGDSKKKAKHNAAEKALTMVMQNKNSGDKLLYTVDSSSSTDNSNSRILNAVGKLNELCSKHCNIKPTYHESGIFNSHFTIKCTLFNHTTEGTGRTKKEAKQLAALEMLDKVKLEDFQIFTADTNIDQRNVFDEEDGTIIKIFKQLSVSKKKCINNITDAIPEDKRNSITENCANFNFDNLRQTTNVVHLKEALRKLQITFTISELQKNPLVLMLKTNSTNLTPSYTFLQSGSTYEETELVLLKKAFDGICILLQ